MAITLGDVIIWIKPDDSKLGAGLNNAEQKTKGWAGRLGGTAAKLVGGAVLGGVTAATGAIVGIGAAALSTGSQIQQGQNDIQASLGLTKEEAQDLGQVAVSVFKDNFGGSIEEATTAVIEARKQLGDLNDVELQNATENAFRLSDVFGVDVSSSLNAANTLMKDFGLTQQEAFDFLASGYQKGLDSSGDFLDTITEYSTQFANAGADADQFFSLMQSGLQGGMLGTDRAADAFKEFRVRIQDGSKTTSDALALIGIDAEGLSQKMADGSVTATDAFQMVIEKLRATDDANVQMQAGVGLLGTQFEDLGTEAALALDLTGTKMADLAGSADSLNAKYNNLGAAFEGLKRRALVALAPVGDKLLGLVNQVMPSILAGIDKLAPILENGIGVAMDFLSNQFFPILKTLGQYFIAVVEDGDFLNDWLMHLPESIKPIVKVLGQVVAFIVEQAIPTITQFGTWFISEGVPAIREFMAPILAQLIPGLIQLATWVGQIAQVLFPILAQVVKFVADNFNIFGPILAVIGGLILALTSPITLIIGAIVLLATAWANNWGGIQEKTQAVMDFIVPKVQWAMNLISSIVSSVLGFIQSWWQKHGDSVITVINFLWNTLVTIFKVALGVIMYAIQGWILLIQSFWQNWGDTIMAVTRFIWETIQTIIKTALDIIGYVIDAAAALIRGDWSALGEALQNIWSTAWSAIQSIIDDAKETLKTAVKNIKKEILGVWDGIKEKFKSIGDSIVQGIKDGISDAWDSLTGWFGDLADKLIEKIKKKFGIGSPSLVFKAIGAELMSGLTLGIEQNQQSPARAMTQTTTNIVNNFYQTINTPHVGNLSGEFQQMRALLST